MATTKSRPKHSGFEGPVRFTVLQDSMKLKRNADGTVSAVPAKKKKKKKNQ